MDAYDIFKKLTKGLTFKNNEFVAKHKESTQKQKLKKEEIKIKEEVVESAEELENEVLSEEEECQSESEASDENETNEFQLVDGVNIGEKKKKKEGKKKPEDLQKKLKLEEQNRFRNVHGIRAVGRHIPPALRDLKELGTRYAVPQTLIDTVVQCGYSEPTPVQRQAMPCMLEDRQILACAPTGSGKTAAFLIPILHSLGGPQGGPRALVLCPTRELAHQIYREALRLSASTTLSCSVVRSIKESKIKEREATIRRSDIVISTPNRLCYLLNQDNVNISLHKVKWLIIDEADKLFEGSAEQQSDFRQQIEQIMTACDSKQRRVAMFSATHTPAVGQWTRRQLRGLINVTVGHRNAATSLVEQELLYCGNENGKLVAFRQLVQKGLRPPVLVFVQSKDRAKQLFKELIYDGINVDVIHADRTQAQRDNVVRSFRVGRIWVLICTELMGRGIDFRGVNLVINYDFPPSAIAYIHRVGRAGRAGQKGKAITFFTQDDVTNLRSIASVIKQSGCEVPEYMLRIKQNANKRKKLLQRAPRRDDISTVLKRADKRKLEESKGTDADSSKDTTKIQTGKNNKNRKIQNNEKHKEQFKKQTGPKNNDKGRVKNKQAKRNGNVVVKKNFKKNISKNNKLNKKKQKNK